ncbi:hypothetical protein ACX1I0_12775 [Yersinia enterocolitica]
MHRQTPVWQVRNTAPFRRLRASPARTRPTCSGATASSGPATGSGNDGGHKGKSKAYRRLTPPLYCCGCGCCSLTSSGKTAKRAKKARRGVVVRASKCTGENGLQPADSTGENGVRWLASHWMKLLWRITI